MSTGCVLGGLLCLMDFFYYIDLICRRNFATAVATKGLSARPLETFGVATGLQTLLHAAAFEISR